MRIVHLITSLGGGGTENFLYQILKGSPKEHQHRVLYLGEDGVIGRRIRGLGIPVERAGIWSFYQALRKEKPDALHTCLHWAHQVGRVGGHWANVPFIASSHRSIDVWQKPWHRLIDRWTLPYCQTVIVNSESARRVIEHRIRNAVPRPSVRRIENGLNLDLFKTIHPEEARRSLGLPAEAWVGGTLMRLHPEKGAEKIPTFAQTLLNQYPKLTLLIAGSGPMETALKEQTRALGERVRWVGWQDDSVRFLSALDFFWLLSREESFPQALLEASGTGIPWIAPDVGGVHELAEAGAAGLAFTPNTAEAAAKAAHRLLANLPEWTAKARDAMPRIQERYDLKRMMRAYYSLIESRGKS